MALRVLLETRSRGFPRNVHWLHKQVVNSKTAVMFLCPQDIPQCHRVATLQTDSARNRSYSIGTCACGVTFGLVFVTQQAAQPNLVRCLEPVNFILVTSFTLLTALKSRTNIAVIFCTRSCQTNGCPVPLNHNIPADPYSPIIRFHSLQIPIMGRSHT
ncbi:hypothetical protein EDD16DRAFT_234376 [Pisolithus croceorrhizus]|nr:hypothetical protein EDD16DRAFT_234376 [Pisolithus croceorrhizus]KAI6165878.1 hypothetical protein EDD17DRAFT_106704 [Pisolithus thermaeus]